MRVLKPILAGFIAVLAAFGILVTAVMIIFAIVLTRPSGGIVGWDPIRLFSPWTAVFVAVTFLAGFLFQFRRQNKNGRISPAAPTSNNSTQ